MYWRTQASIESPLEIILDHRDKSASWDHTTHQFSKRLVSALERSPLELEVPASLDRIADDMLSGIMGGSIFSSNSLYDTGARMIREIRKGAMKENR